METNAQTRRTKPALLRGVQSRILMMTIAAVVVPVVLLVIIAITSFSNALTEMVKNNMQGLATAYGQELWSVVTANNGEMLDTDSLTTLFQNVTIEGVEGSYCYVVDGEGTMIYHPTESKIGQPVENVVVTGLVEEIAKGNTPDPDAIEYDFNGSTKLAGYYVLRGGRAIVVITADKDAALSEIQSFITQSVACAVVILVLMILIGSVVARSIARPIKLMTQTIDKNASLDFTDTEWSEKLGRDKGETGIMSGAMDAMRENLVEMVQRLDQTAGNLRMNADGLKGIVEELNSNSCDNSATSEELAASMQETSATTQLIDERMDGVNENAKEISALTTEGEKNANEIIKKADGLKKDTEVANERTKEIYSRVKKESDVAIEKAKEINQINALTDAIAAIASQTELLSLNASIEAARAGEAGRGFAVVAGEIGSLASQSTETANNITAIVSGVKDAAESMEQCLMQMIKFMEENVMVDYANFIRVSEEYSADATNFSDSMRTINSSISDLENNIDDIAHSVQDINRTVNEAAISVTDIAQKATDMVGYAGDTGEKAEDNARFAEELDSIVKMFKV